MAERKPNEVWIERISRAHSYIRIGPEKNLATVNFPYDSPEAEVVRKALEDFYSACANGNASQMEIGKHES